MPKIRVLVVDDAVVIRRLVSDLLSTDPEIEVVGVAANGKLALAKLDQLAPDLITLDIEMPEMDGLETLIHLRKLHPRLPVIMFSTLTERGASATMDALARGRVAVPRLSPPAGRRPAPTVAQPVFPRVAFPSRADILAIGVSTGGPNALAAVLSQLPRDFPLPIVIVQHMPPVFTRLLAERLNTSCHLEVKEGEAGAVLRPGLAWIAPGNHHMVLRRTANAVQLVLTQDEPENSCRPAVDPLFRSVAQLYGAHTLGLVLTGMGYDGLRGAELIRQVHGMGDARGRGVGRAGRPDPAARPDCR
jgi:two-component system chemotaxis response regulator CheB